MKDVEYAYWHITLDNGKRSRTRWKMPAEKAYALDPNAVREESSVEVINLPETAEEIHRAMYKTNSTSGFLRGRVVLVCGGREFNNREAVFRALDKLHAARSVELLIHGAAPGADTLADLWALERGITRKACPADWKTHGKRAGPLRNTQMLTFMPDGVVAFPGGRGTADMIQQAQTAGLKVWKPFG